MKSVTQILAVCFLLLGLSSISSSCRQQFSSIPTKEIDPRVGGDSVVNKRSAYELTENHRNRELIGEGKFKNGRSFYFTQNFLSEVMLKQPGAVGLNFYLALDKNRKDIGKVALLYVVAVNSKGKDLTGLYFKSAADSVNKKQSEYIIGETEMRCPNNCDELSSLYKDPE